MKTRFGMSTIGYAIVLVIILGVVMIFSAPMIVDKYDAKSSKNNQNTELKVVDIDEQNQFRDFEDRFNSRLSDIEKRQTRIENSNEDKYVCSIEGTVDELGNIVEINSQSDVKNQKIVFVCEYRR